MSDRIFRGLADPVRREILELLRWHPLPVEEIASHFPVSRPAISKHLRVLREAGLVSEQKSGRQRFYALSAARLEPAQRWLEGLGSGPAETRPTRSARAPRPSVREAQREGRARSSAISEEAETEDWRSW